MLGVKRGAVFLCDHEKEWETEAERTIEQLKGILGPVIRGIEHIGSTALPIKAKPIIDIVLAVDDINELLAFREKLEAQGFYFCPNAQAQLRGQWLFACGSYYDGSGELQTHFIHVVKADSTDFRHYTVFRDYLRKMLSAAHEYEAVKISLAQQASKQGGRERYTAEKQAIVTRLLRQAVADDFLRKTVTVKIDRPLGSVHPQHPSIVYPINYGYLPEEPGFDGKDVDAYVLGVDTPLSEFTGTVIGAVLREDDVEDKLVVAPEGMLFHQAQIEDAVYFQERFFKTFIKCQYQKSCGAILFCRTEGELKFLVLLQRKSGTWSFPKGHMERGETETETALREIREEAGYTPTLLPDFRVTATYSFRDGTEKEVVLFLAEIESAPTLPEKEISSFRFVTATEAKTLLPASLHSAVDTAVIRLDSFL